MRRLASILALSLVTAAATATTTDPWDAIVGDDDGPGTDNELVHGTIQQHDLQAQSNVEDEDWYRIGRQPYSSHEVVVDGLGQSVAVVPAVIASDQIQLHLVTAGDVQLVSSAPISSIGSSRSLRFRNTSASEITNEYVRIRPSSNACGNQCTATSVYRITMRETTMFAPRFNNSGTQITVLILQNATNGFVAYTARFFSGLGTLLGTASGTLAPHGGAVINTAGIAGLAGTSGVISIDHLAPYGGLTGKTVALEPATGFSFDTLLAPRPY